MDRACWIITGHPSTGKIHDWKTTYLEILSAQSIISSRLMLKETWGNAVVMFKQLHHLTPVGRSRWQDSRRVINLSPACQDGLLHIQIVQRCLHCLASPDSIVQLARVSSTSCLASICVNAIQYHSLPFHHVIHIWCIQRTILSFGDIARAQMMYDTYMSRIICQTCNIFQHLHIWNLKFHTIFQCPALRIGSSPNAWLVPKNQWTLSGLVTVDPS